MLTHDTGKPLGNWLGNLELFQPKFHPDLNQNWIKFLLGKDAERINKSITELKESIENITVVHKLFKCEQNNYEKKC